MMILWSLYKELQNLRKVDIHADGTEILSKEQMLQRREKAEAGGGAGEEGQSSFVETGEPRERCWKADTI